MLALSLCHNLGHSETEIFFDFEYFVKKQIQCGSALPAPR